jgi:glycosyltransferase involved in cell wall biosynthesis
MTADISIILPAKNEARSLEQLLPRLREHYPEEEIIVIDDGSNDETVTICNANAVTVVSHPYSMGNGAAIKTGARAASGSIFLFMDADSQHDPDTLGSLLDELDKGFDMAVGARGFKSQASAGRGFANTFYNWFASKMTGHRVMDLTSGLRAVRAEKFMEFLSMLPNGFSYPTTITMAFFRSGYSVSYVPVTLNKRIGKSHINLIRDGIRFLLIIFRIGTLYSPLKLFTPISAFFLVMGLGHYANTFLTQGRFTNMSALLLITSVLVFLIGLVSEQITNLVYLHLHRK